MSGSTWGIHGARRASIEALCALVLLAAAGPAAAQASAAEAASAASVAAAAAPPGSAVATSAAVSDGANAKCPPLPARSASGLSAVIVDRCSLAFRSPALGASSAAQRVILAAPSDTGLKRVDLLPSGAFSVKPAQCDFSRAGSCVLSVEYEAQHAGPEEGAIVLQDAVTSATRVAVALAGGGVSCDVRNDVPCKPWRRFAFVALGAALYLSLLLFGRWHKVALPTRRVLCAEITAVEARVGMVRGDPGVDSVGIERVDALLVRAREALDESGWGWFWNFLFWSRGSEVASWGLLHEAEEQLVCFMTTEELRTGLERASAQLRLVGGAVAPGLADRIEAELKHTVLALDDAPAALLRAVLGLLQAPDAELRKAVADALATPAAAGASVPADLAARLLAVLGDVPPALAGGLTALLPATPAAPLEVQLLLAQADARLASTAAAAAALRTAIAANTVRDALALANDTVLVPGALLATRIQAALDAKPTWPIARWRALLSEALGVLYDRWDTDFATLAGWQNKVVWMIKCALLLVVALGTALGHGVLFLVGACGGLMSRLSRTLDRPDVMTDYGASWSRLFLSPVIGALAGWAALLLAALLLKLGILGSLFTGVDWDSPIVPLSLGIAFLFGFSERAFDSVISALDEKVMSRSPSATEPSEAGSALAITTSTLKPAQAGQGYTDTLGASGGAGSYVWSVTAGAAPKGLKIVDNTIAGTVAPDAKTATFTVQVRDKDGKTASKALTITVS